MNFVHDQLVVCRCICFQINYRGLAFRSDQLPHRVDWNQLSASLAALDNAAYPECVIQDRDAVANVIDRAGMRKYIVNDCVVGSCERTTLKKLERFQCVVCLEINAVKNFDGSRH